MKITLTRAEKEAICDRLEWPIEIDEESLAIHKEWLKAEWTISDNPADDDLLEALDKDYPYPFKLITEGYFYEALTVYIFDCFSKEHQDQLKQSENFDKWKNLF